MSKFKVGNQEAQVHIEMSSKLLPSAPSSTRAKNTSKKNHIKRQESRALSLHSELGASVELAASWGGVPVMENVMKHRSVLEKQLAGVEKALAKLDRQVEVINTLPEGNIHKQVVETSPGMRCIKQVFGETAPPRPCGSCQYQAVWIMSGSILAIVKYVFAVTCAIMVHESHDAFRSSVGIGVLMQLACMFVGQFVIVPFTQIGVTVAGPDVVAAIFASAMAEIIGDNTMDHPERAVPTLLFCMALTTLCTGICWVLLGYFKAARMVDYLPVCVVCGFMGILAYKVVYYCIKISVGYEWYHPELWPFWKLLLPVIPMGFGLYYVKKFHHQLHLNPIVILAVFLFVPPGIMFAVVGANNQTMTESMEDLRTDGWLFQEMSAIPFESTWANLTFSNLDGNSILLCLPSLFTCVIVITIALLINIQALKQILNVPEVDAGHELRINGWCNVIASLFIAAPAYTQIKFSLLNYHIIGNKTDKKPGLFAGVFALLMGGFEVLLINYLPRITLGMLLLYAGLPLIEDNLIFSIRRVTKKEFVTTWVIVLVNAVAGVWTSYAFLIAVITGLVLSTIIFAVQYGRNPVIRGFISGRDYQSSVVRPYTEQRLVEKIGVRVKIMELEGYLFFGSTIQLLNKFKTLVMINKTTPFPERVRYFILDFTHVKNIDHSSCLTFKDLKQIARPSWIVLVFTGMNNKVLEKMRTHGVLPASDAVDFSDSAPVIVHSDLDHGAEYVENLLLNRATLIRSQWLVFDSFRKAHSEALIKTSCEAFEAVIGGDVGVNLWKYASLRTLENGQVLCKQGSINHTLYVLQEGVLTSFVIEAGGRRRRLHKMTRGAFVNDECLFLDLPVAFSVVANRDCVLWAISRANMKQMEAHDPHLAMEILRKVLRHTSIVRSRLEREVQAVQLEVLDDVAVTAMKKKKNDADVSKRIGRTILEGSQLNLDRNDDGNYWEVLNAFGPAVDDERNSFDKSHRTSVGWASGDHHHHAFQHLHLPTHAVGDSPIMSSQSAPTDASSKLKATRLSPTEVDAVQPHLSKHELEDARKCFFFHADHIHIEVDKQFGTVIRRPMNDLVLDQIPIALNAQQDDTESTKSSFEQQRSTEKYLDLEELEKAVMDLGVFPSHDEVSKMHATLSHDHERDFVDLDEFLDMIRSLKLAPLSRSAKKELYRVYVRASNDDDLLSRADLSILLTALGHPDDEVELEQLMQEWDVQERGFLDFDAFLSIVSTTLKAEAMQVNIENDFLNFYPHGRANMNSDKKSNANKSEDLLNYQITADDLIRVHTELGLVLTQEIAEEMLFDADVSSRGGVDFDDLISCIETIGTNEVYEAMATNRTGLRAIQEAKMGEKFAVSLEAGIDNDYTGSTQPLQLLSSQDLKGSPGRAEGTTSKSAWTTLDDGVEKGGRSLNESYAASIDNKSSGLAQSNGDGDSSVMSVFSGDTGHEQDKSEKRKAE